MEKTSHQAIHTGRTIILADGDFPLHPEPLAYWAAAERVVCCDGAARQAVARDVEPAAVVGDGDSLSPALRDRLGARWVCDPGQTDNDLAKTLRYCLVRGWRRLAILGATGRREDHTLGNLSLLADFCAEADVVLATDTGLFTAHTGDVELASCAGQPVSIFAFDPQMPIRSRGLRYPLNGLRLSRWWQAALNEAQDESFALSFTGGVVLVFRAWPASPGTSVRA
jgi:thiamine pyrophosphokinase